MLREERIRRFVDGEMDGAERAAFAAERALSSRLDAEVKALEAMQRGLATMRLPHAPRAEVAGEWSAWQPVPLARSHGGGEWTLSLPLARGDWRYTFLVDGRRVDDPHAGAYRPDGFGGRNAVLSL